MEIKVDSENPVYRLFAEAFKYDPDTGKLIWKSDRYAGRYRHTLKAAAGSEAGSIAKSGYRFVTINDKSYRAHRVAMSIHLGGMIPSHVEVDHVNHNPADNRLENLRLASRSQNMANRKGASSNSKSGFRGVSFSRNRWIARVNRQGTVVHVGTFLTKEEAAEAAKLKRLELFGEYAGGA